MAAIYCEHCDKLVDDDSEEHFMQSGDCMIQFEEKLRDVRERLLMSDMKNNVGDHGRCEECGEYYCKKDCPKWRRENDYS